MENHVEQSVTGRQRAGDAALYRICWAVLALLVLLAMFFAAGALEENSDALKINWPKLICAAACLLGALAAFRGKDYLRREYDYMLHGQVLEICLILNGRRRRRLAEIEIERIERMGAASGADFEHILRRKGLKRQNWFADADAPLYYLCYTKQSERCVAVLQLNEEMLAALRRKGSLTRDAG